MAADGSVYLALERPTFISAEALPKGKTKLVVDFAYDGGGLGKGGAITMSANGKRIAGGRLERTIPVQMSITDGLDVGMDIGSSVDYLQAAVPVHRKDRAGDDRVEMTSGAADATAARTRSRALTP